MKNNHRGSSTATTTLQNGAYEYCPTPTDPLSHSSYLAAGSTSILAAMKKSLKHKTSNYVINGSPSASASNKVVVTHGNGDEDVHRNGWSVAVQWSRMRNSLGRTKKISFQDNEPINKYHQRSASGTCHSEGQHFSSEEHSREGINHASQENLSWSGSTYAYFNRHAIEYINREESRHSTSVNCHPSITLHEKYQPKSFDEIVGHDIVVKLLSNAIQERQVPRLYLFHGPRGNGKTTTAKLFAMALLCDSTSHQKPCWHCGGCNRSLYIMKLCTGSRTTGFHKISTLLLNTSFMQALPGFKVFIIEESHSLTVEAWEELLSILENHYNSKLVFVLIAAEANMIPMSIESRCQKFYFQKLKNMDIRRKLTQIISHEDLRVDDEALNLIVSKADGSLQEAEHLMVQLTLLGPRITTSMVQQLVGLVPQSKLLTLLIAALSGNTQKTVTATRELIATGIEAQAIISQLVSTIADILSGAIPCSPTPARLIRNFGSK